MTLSSPKILNRPTDTFKRKAKGSIKIFLCSIYHPYEFDKQREFYDELNHFITTRTRNSDIFMWAEVNCNVGKISKRFKDILGPHGLDNWNLKGRDILYLYKSNNFKILLSFFAHTNYIIYRSFNDSKTPHMLDNFISCGNFFKRIRDCKVNRLGVRSNHDAIMTPFRLTSIKFNNDHDDIIIIDWQKI